MGHYELFGNRYFTLYDLVYHLSQADSELPHRLVYGTISKVEFMTFLFTYFKDYSRGPPFQISVLPDLNNYLHSYVYSFNNAENVKLKYK